MIIDKDLIIKAQSGDDKAIMQLLDIIDSTLNYLSNKYWVRGSTPEDIKQDLICEFLSSILPTLQTEEYEIYTGTIAQFLKRKMVTIIIKENGKSRNILNESLYFGTPIGCHTNTYGEYLSEIIEDPNNTLNNIVNSDNYQYLMECLKKATVLSDLHLQVLDLYLSQNLRHYNTVKNMLHISNHKIELIWEDIHELLSEPRIKQIIECIANGIEIPKELLIKPKYYKTTTLDYDKIMELKQEGYDYRDIARMYNIRLRLVYSIVSYYKVVLKDNIINNKFRRQRIKYTEEELNTVTELHKQNYSKRNISDITGITLHKIQGIHRRLKKEGRI